MIKSGVCVREREEEECVDYDLKLLLLTFGKKIESNSFTRDF